MLIVNDSIQIPDNEISCQFILASGPGGQNVNKVATAAQLRFNVIASPSLPESVRTRLLILAKTRMNKDGELIITARRYRTQERNKEDAMQRLASLIKKAAVKPKTRIKRKPSLAAKKRRLEEKRKRSTKKQDRKPVRY